MNIRTSPRASSPIGSTSAPKFRAMVAGRIVEPAFTLCCVLILVACAIAGAVLQGKFPIADSAMFEYTGRAIVHGQALYRDLWDNKLPGVYYVNALWYTLFGDAYALHALAEVCVAFVSCALLAAVIRSFELRGGLAAATVLAVLLCLTFTLNTTEVYALPFILTAVLTGRRNHAVVAGFAIGIATVFWIQSILMVLPISMLLTRRLRLRLALSAICVPALVFLSLLLALGPARIFQLFEAWAAYISTPPPTRLYRHIRLLNELAPVVTFVSNLSFGLLISGAAALCTLLLATLRKPATQAQRFGLTWTAVMLVATLVGTRFYSHYFIPSLPALAFTIVAFARGTPITIGRIALAAAAMVLALGTIYNAHTFWRQVGERSALSARIGSAIHPIVAGRLTLDTDSYTPDLYLALDPKLRSPFEIIARANDRFVRRLSLTLPPADISVHRLTEASSGVRVCTRTAAPWSMFVPPALTQRFTNCP